jgi:hypothetical protein
MVTWFDQLESLIPIQLVKTQPEPGLILGTKTRFKIRSSFGTWTKFLPGCRTRIKFRINFFENIYIVWGKYLELGVNHQFQTRLPRVRLELGLISRTITKIKTWIFFSITRLEPDPRFHFFSWRQNHNCNKWHYVLRNLNVTKRKKQTNGLASFINWQNIPTHIMRQNAKTSQRYFLKIIIYI